MVIAPIRVCVCVRACTCSVPSDSLQPYGLQPDMLLCLWNFPGKNTRVGSHFLLQGIPSSVIQPTFLDFLHGQADSLRPQAPLGKF